MRQPLFAAPGAQTVQGRVVWVPEAAGDDALVDYSGSTLPATVPPGVTLADQDLVSLLWIGRTLRVSQVIAHAPTLTEGA